MPHRRASLGGVQPFRNRLRIHAGLRCQDMNPVVGLNNEAGRHRGGATVATHANTNKKEFAGTDNGGFVEHRAALANEGEIGVEAQAANRREVLGADEEDAVGRRLIEKLALLCVTRKAGTEMKEVTNAGGGAGDRSGGGMSFGPPVSIGRENKRDNGV